MNSSAAATHPDARKWDENWTAVSSGEGGGQGDVKIVVRKDGSEPGERFLKILRHQNDLSRRQRMYREVASYLTLQHPAIPKLIETNAENFGDQSYKLYLVTEVVKGLTLDKYVESHGPLPLLDAIGFAIALLGIVEHCHQSEVVHRDIKPANIILRELNPGDPVLVDFGLSFNDDEVARDATDLYEEVGNRFLRLPELAPSSPIKRDLRSDVTFCSGVLLYALTGEVPAVLADGHGRLPHQVESVSERLLSIGDIWRVSQLKRVFDTAFQNALTSRWQSAGELISELQRIETGAIETPMTRKALLEDVRVLQGSASSKAKQQLLSSLERALQEISAVMSSLEAQRIAPMLRPTQTAYEVRIEERRAKTALCFLTSASSSIDPSIQFRVDAIGTELVISSTYAGALSELHRTPLDSPTFGPAFQEAIEQVFIQQIRDELLSEQR